MKQNAHEIITGVVDSLGTHCVGIHEHVGCCLCPLFRSHRGIEPKCLFCPVEHLGPVGLRNAHHVGDHVKRKPQRKIVDQVGACAFGQSVDDVVGARAQHVAQFGDPFRSEALIDDLAEFHMVGRIEADHQLIAASGSRFVDPIIDEGIGRVAIGRCISRNLLNLGVASDHP
ncbi:unannotated protein [freshwater metagenome]